MSESLVKFLQHYNLRRRHSSLKKELKVRTPFEVLEFWQNAKPEIFKKYCTNKKLFSKFESNLFNNLYNLDR
ncbi:MAG: hypothetical protein U0V04_17430 [Spirosomataceae bacterium]